MIYQQDLLHRIRLIDLFCLLSVPVSCDLFLPRRKSHVNRTNGCKESPHEIKQETNREKHSKLPFYVMRKKEKKKKTASMISIPENEMWRDEKKTRYLQIRMRLQRTTISENCVHSNK